MEKLTNKLFFKVVIWLLPLSYFYNLPVIKYSIKGDNEFRLYDILGGIIVFFYIQNFKLINHKINQVVFFRRFNYFIIYCSISIIFTLLFSVFYKDRIVWFIQSFLYLYHMWIFYLGSVFFYLYVSSKEKYLKMVTYILVLIIVESIIVILQNLDFIPFLFNSVYKISYHGFLSGTFGPNKIVLGMIMLISIPYIIGLLYENKLKVSKTLLWLALFGSSISILLSGSRTTYLGLAVFLIYFFVKKINKFISLSIIASILFSLLFFSNIEIIDRINNTINDRIVNKIERPEQINSLQDFTGLYDDLGSGRNDLQLKYLKYLAEKPYVLPFGVGFNNRLIIGNSAHNIYLSLINEVGIFGLILFIRWLFSYLIINKNKFSFLQMSLNGLVISMLITLFFGEHLYVYRPLFGILGYFMIICVLLIVPFRKPANEK